MSLYSVVAKISLLASIACLGLAYVLAGDWFIVSFFLVMAAILFFLKKKFRFWANSGMLFLCVFLATLGLMKDLSLPLMVLGCTASLASWDLANFGQSIRDNRFSAQENPLEKHHLQSLAVAVSSGLGLVLISLAIHMQAPFAIVVILILIAVGCLTIGLHFVVTPR